MLTTVCIAAIVLAAIYWLVGAYAAIRTIRNVPRLRSWSPGPLTASVSIVFAARDEASSVRTTVERFAALGSGIDVIAVNDRSTDATGELFDALADRLDNVTAFHVDELPTGWLGKVHALHTGVGHARGEWIVLTDADVDIEAGVIERAIGAAQQHGAVHVSAIPDVDSPTALVSACVSVFARWLTVAGRLWRVNDPTSTVTFGIGAFNMIRRDALEAGGTLEWLKMELADDAGIGMLAQHAGGHSLLVSGRGLISVPWQTSVRGMTANMEKYGGVQFDSSVVRTSIAMGIPVLAEFLPWLALVAAPTTPIRSTAAVVCLLSICVLVALLGWAGRLSFGVVFWQPLAAVLNAWMQVRAAALERKRGGIVWRGTLYRTEDLQAGRRFRIDPPLLGAVGSSTRQS
jgi:cellulose synthase/poly-beta-1,6-N-acetylglucosamine synthase-like glycosyltransferase